MFRVLHLNPAWGPAAAIGVIAALRDQAFQSHIAGGLEQVWPDLALFEGAAKMPSRSAR